MVKICQIFCCFQGQDLQTSLNARRWPTEEPGVMVYRGDSANEQTTLPMAIGEACAAELTQFRRCLADLLLSEDILRA
jgi:hypothetical protein